MGPKRPLSVRAQVYTAEEKAALAMFNAEEAQRKEDNLLAEMRKLVDAAVNEAGGPRDADGGDSTGGAAAGAS